MIKLNPAFHMITTIAVIAAIAEKKKRSQRSVAIIWNHSQAIAATTIVGDRCRCDRWRVVSIWSLNVFLFSDRSDHSDRSHHMETGLIKTILYIRVALTSERLVSRFFHDKFSFTKTSMSGAILWAVYKFCPVPKISQVMMKRRRRASHLDRFTLRHNGRRATQLCRFTL